MCSNTAISAGILFKSICANAIFFGQLPFKDSGKIPFITFTFLEFSNLSSTSLLNNGECLGKGSESGGVSKLS